MPPQPALEEVRDKFGGSGVSDDQLLMYYVAGKDDVDRLRGVGAPKEYISARKPLLMLLQELTRHECNQIYIRRKGMTVALQKNSAAAR